jgi:hypothetical protein
MIKAGFLRRSLTLLAVFSMVMLSAISCARKPARVQWKLAEGKTYLYRSEITGSWRIEGWEMGERGREFGNLLEYEMIVESIDTDSVMKIKEIIHLVREDAEYEPTVITYNMTPTGKITEVADIAEGTAPRTLPASTRRENYMEETQPTFPEHPLSAGEYWAQETKVVTEDRVITVTNKFRVRGWEKVGDYNCLHVTYDGEMFIPYESKGRNLLDQGTVKGSIWFAPAEGLLVQKVDTFYMATARIVPEGEQPPATYIVESVRIHQLVEIRP